MAKINVPSLRFKGFNEGWKEEKAKNIFKNESIKKHGEEEVLASTQDNGIIFRRDLDIDIKFDKSTLDNYKYVVPGNVVISLRSFQGGFEISDKRGIISPAYTIMSFKDGYNKTNYWKQYLKTYKFIQSLKKVTFGIRDGRSISFNEFSTLKLKFTDNKDEQKKIGDFFSKIDKIINLQTQKLEQLKQLKRGYLQSIFPQNGQILPKFRFGGFNEDWLEKELNDYLSIPEKEEINVKQINQIMTVKLHFKGAVKNNAPSTLKLGSTKYYKRHKGQFIYGRQNFFNGAMAIVPENFEGLGTSSFIPSFDVNHIKPEFLYDYVSRYDYYMSYEKYAIGTGSKLLNEQDFLKFRIVVPTDKEQVAIIDFINYIDCLINANSEKLTKLKQQKKAYLQKMFI